LQWLLLLLLYLRSLRLCSNGRSRLLLAGCWLSIPLGQQKFSTPCFLSNNWWRCWLGSLGLLLLLRHHGLSLRFRRLFGGQKVT
jgi:hypothetical protein